jgi:hypothetical protein
MDTSGTLQVSVADHGTTLIKVVAGLTITSLPIKPTGTQLGIKIQIQLKQPCKLIGLKSTRLKNPMVG